MEQRSRWRDPMLNYPTGLNTRGEHRIPPARLIVELTEAQLERLNRASGEQGAAALLRSVALALADQANEIQRERLRAAFAVAEHDDGFETTPGPHRQRI